MSKVVRLTMTISSLSYLITSIAGYLSFGRHAPEIFTDLKPYNSSRTFDLFFNIGKLLVAIHLMMAIPVSTVPLYQ